MLTSAPRSPVSVPKGVFTATPRQMPPASVPRHVAVLPRSQNRRATRNGPIARVQIERPKREKQTAGANPANGLRRVRRVGMRLRGSPSRLTAGFRPTCRQRASQQPAAGGTQNLLLMNEFAAWRLVSSAKTHPHQAHARPTRWTGRGRVRIVKSAKPSGINKDDVATGILALDGSQKNNL